MTGDSRTLSSPTADDLNWAHEEFEKREPRSLFYKAAIELVDLALQEKTRLTVAEAIAVLLQTWNREYYRFRRFTEEHYHDIEALWTTHSNVLTGLRVRAICGFSENDWPLVTAVFGAFRKVLGPVGAAKALHLLAREFCPLWDNRIAVRGYQVTPSTDSYLQFMLNIKAQCDQICWSRVTAPYGRLKALDEYNYVTYTLGIGRPAD
jgi:hypothetical protein